MTTPSPPLIPASSSKSPQGENVTVIDAATTAASGLPEHQRHHGHTSAVPITLPPISQLASYSSEHQQQQSPPVPPPSYHHDQGSGPSSSASVPQPALSSSSVDNYGRQLRHGKQRSDDSLAASSSDNNNNNLGSGSQQGALDDDLHTEPEDAAAMPGSSGGGGGSGGGAASGDDSQLQQKRKRTRTLTTPHQSAVLHALLAQSRFPSTAMREEVGRSIGLSARKVQVWFQNQRQKARKPRTPSTSSATVDLTRPPSPSSSRVAGADGGYTIGESPPTHILPHHGLPASSHHHHHHPPPLHPPPEYITPRYTAEPHQQQPHVTTHPRGLPQSAAVPGGLPLEADVNRPSTFYVDPGMRALGHRHHASYHHHHPMRPTPYPVQQQPQHFLRHTQSFGDFCLTRTHLGGSSSGGGGEHLRSSAAGGGAAIQLPPLHLESVPDSSRRARPSSTNPSLSSSSSSSEIGRSAMPLLIPSLSPLEISCSPPGQRSTSTTVAGGGATRPSVIIPPPFTLQPAPQWEWDRTLNPPVGPRRTPHVRPRTASDPTLPPLNISEGNCGSQQQPGPLITQPWPPTDSGQPLTTMQRRSSEGTTTGGRFDPVHSVAPLDPTRRHGEGENVREDESMMDISPHPATSRNIPRR